MDPSTFDDLNIDAMSGAELMGLLGLQPYQLNDPIIFGRVHDVVNYMRNVPDKPFFVNRITAGKQVDRLNHVWSYIQVLGKKEGLMSELKKTEEEQAKYE